MINLKFIIISAVLALVGCTNNEVATNIPPVNKPVELVQPVVKTAKLSVVGDIMCHSWQYNEAYNNQTGEYDFNHNYQDVKKYFDKADLTIGNFETVTAGVEAGGYSDYPIFNSPDSFALAMKNAGVDLVTTANNHCMDKKRSGLLRTIDVLDNLQIDHVGTYKSPEERDKILIKDINGIKIAFLSYTYGTNGINVPEPYLVNIMDETIITEDIKRAKELNPDFVVVLPHMGNEYETYTRDVFKNWADIMFNAGADIILASHPHVLQPMEFKTIIDEDGSQREGFIIYSLGNFISSQTTPPRNASIILNLELEKTDDQKAIIKQVSFVPIWTQFSNVSNKNHFIVRSVYEMLSLPEEELFNTVRKKDINRLWQIHAETSKVLLGYEVPIEEMNDEYIFSKN